MTLRALVVDDTALYRKVLSDILTDLGVEVVGTANNGKIALAKIEHLRPDFVTMDFEMPEMDGLETLRQMKKSAPETAAIMVSAHTRAGASITLEALELGAFDFIAKPEGASALQNVESMKSQLRPILASFQNRRGIKQSLRPSRPLPVSPVRTGKIDVVAIGISTGGPNALTKVIPQLPANLGVPIVIVQHMPPVFTAALAESLDRKSPLRVVEGAQGMVLEPDMVVLAPGGKQMKLVSDGGKAQIAITDDPPENHCKPAADYLFRSVAQLYGKRALGVIMTGMGADGTRGLKEMKLLGARVIAQDETTSVVFGMPMEAIKAGIVDTVLPLDEIAGEITKLVRKP